MVDAVISPKGQLDLLSQTEINNLKSSSKSIYAQIFRDCILAVLSTGCGIDDGEALLAQHKDFEIDILSSPRGLKLKLSNAPENAFVDGQIIQGIRNHLFAVLRDIVHLQDQYKDWSIKGDHASDMVFKSLRNARTLKPRQRPNIIVCWGGHSINEVEYNYTKEVGYRLGLRGMDICTGCGIGAMKGPMKGATIAHAKQRMRSGRYIGISEPGIIAAESPNAIVNELIIMPDIEKRLEAFVRLGHGIIVFPGGVGTAEEILYILGILLNQNNQDIKLPLVFTGPKESAQYFKDLDKFIGLTLGEKAQSLYKIIIEDPISVAKTMKQGLSDVHKNRRATDDAFYFNWSLDIAQNLQERFEPTHENVANLNLNFGQPIENLAADLRRAFSAIVAGNVKPEGISRIKEFGPYEINGDEKIMASLDKMLQSFASQQRMKLNGTYKPCYKLITT